MAKLLYIKASPRGERSFSIRAADAFVASYKNANPDDAIEELDLFKAQIPEFDAAAAEGKYAIIYGKEDSDASKAAWKKVVEVIDYFKSFDKYVLAVPMWNFGLPYRLKLYLDTIIQPTHTFAVKGDGSYEGLLTGRKVLSVYSSGGEYAGEAAAIDHQKPHLEFLLGFMGLEDRQQITLAGTLGPAGNDALKVACSQAEELAKEF